MDKAPDAFRTISEVAEDLDVPQHVLRFWESRFAQIRPMKRGGGRRYYRPDDVDLLRGIRHLLYGEGYTIRGVQRILREQGGRFVQSVWRDGAPQPDRHAAQGADEDDSAQPDESIGLDADEDDEGSEHEGPEAALQAPRVVRVTPPARIKGDGAEAPAPRPALSPEQLRGLKKALDGLIECRRLLDAAIDAA